MLERWIITLDLTGSVPVAISAARLDRGVGTKIGWRKFAVMAYDRADAIRLAKEAASRNAQG